MTPTTAEILAEHGDDPETLLYRAEYAIESAESAHAEGSNNLAADYVRQAVAILRARRWVELRNGRAA